jgi:hypothetical protein
LNIGTRHQRTDHRWLIPRNTDNQLYMWSYVDGINQVKTTVDKVTKSIEDGQWQASTTWRRHSRYASLTRFSYLGIKTLPYGFSVWTSKPKSEISMDSTF